MKGRLRRTPLIRAGVSCALASTALALLDGQQVQAASRHVTADSSDVPAGVVLIDTRIGGDGNPFGRNRGTPAVVFADSSAHPLYFSSSDAGCTGVCLQTWRPALAPANARAVGDWSLVARGSGERQWAFRGKLLYSFGKDPEFFREDVRGDIFGGVAFTAAARLKGQGVDGMIAARAEPTQWMKMPNGVSTTEYRIAPGQVLAVGVGGATATGKPLYIYTGAAAQESKLPAMFRPQLASELDLPVGDFTIRDRADGTRQWVYHGAPLYLCDCDVDVGDLNGKDRAPDIAPASVLRYPLPSEVVLKWDPLSGGHLVEARSGRTLYYRDRVKDAWEPDNFRNPAGPQDPLVGATLGLKHCDAKCEKTWHPLFAPRDAQPQGYWSVYARPDGKKQWAYKNFALYTHAGEPPGSLNGNETYLIRYDEGRGSRPPEEFGMGLVWRAALP